MAGTVKQRRLWKVLVVGFALLTFFVGFISGYFAGKHVGLQELTNCYSELVQYVPPSNEVQPGLARGMPAKGTLLRELTPPWGEEVAKSQDVIEADSANEMYVFFADTGSITTRATEIFLQQLQQSLSTSQQVNVSTADLADIIETFESVAEDVLSYLRYHNSEALLLLLRQFSVTGALSLADADPDVLQREVQHLLNETALGEWYLAASQRASGAITTNPPEVWQTAASTATELLRDSDSDKQPKGSNDRRLAATHIAAPTRKSYLANRRHLQATAPAANASKALPAIQGAPIPVIPDSKAYNAFITPTVSPLMTMQEMLCFISEYSPTGLQGMSLPGAQNATARNQSITCPTLPSKPTIFRYQDLVFKPVKIPVVFHCQRFAERNVLMPPLWSAEKAAAHLISATNKLFDYTSIQFEVREVRYDVKKYPYLLLGSLNDWQQCTGSPSQEAAGFPCLTETAQDPSFAALTKEYVINVIVGGSQSSPFCNRTESEACTALYSGVVGSYGPWFLRPSRTWSESSLTQNWVFITWDMFSPMIKNAMRFWDGGAVTLAHELGHYLGLMHTHEGTQPCEGNGLTKADAVPDTPVNRLIIGWAADKGLAVELARWCGDFRTGKKPQPRELLKYDSCQTAPTVIDNVFNLMSYLPDSCNMMMSANQVARLQWAIAKFRPKMMAKYAVK